MQALWYGEAAVTIGVSTHPLDSPRLSSVGKDKGMRIVKNTFEKAKGERLDLHNIKVHESAPVTQSVVLMEFRHAD